MVDTGYCHTAKDSYRMRRIVRNTRMASTLVLDITTTVRKEAHVNEEGEGRAGNKVKHTKKSIKDSMAQFNIYHTEVDPGYSKRGGWLEHA